MIVNALNQRFNLGDKPLIGFSFLHLDHLPFGMLLLLYLTLAILTYMQTVTLATELFVGSVSGPIENPRGRMSKGDVVYVQHKMDFHVTDPHLS